MRYFPVFFLVVAATCVAIDYSVFIVDSPVTNDVILPGRPLPEACRPGKVLTIEACPGEYEPASFLVITPEPLESVRIEVAPLSGAAGVLPADCIDVRIVKRWQTSGPIEDLKPPPKVLVKNDAVLVRQLAPTADNPQRLINVAPNGLRDTAQLQPCRIDQLKQFWITAHVFESTQPGNYTTTLRVIPGNAEPVELTLELEVYSFPLLPPMLDYSTYYPVTLVSDDSENWRTGKWTNTAWITAAQYELELRNMLAHGVTNPNLYCGVGKRQDGTLDFSGLEAVLALREKVGIGPGVPLYAMNQAAEPISRRLTAAEMAERTRDVRDIMAWGRQRGYEDIYWAAIDEAGSSRLVGERDSFQAIRDGGGKTWVACSRDYFDLVGDLLDHPVYMCDKKGGELDRLQESLSLDHPRMLPLDDTEGRARNKARLAAEFAEMIGFTPDRAGGLGGTIDEVHRLGRKIYTYTYPWSAWPLPAVHRHHNGLGLWKLGFDGSMTWAFTHIKGDLGPGKIRQGFWGYVIRTENGVLDTLRWEGFREGVDDVRYLTTLIDAIGRATGTVGSRELVTESLAWLSELNPAAGSLNAIRSEMARRIIALRSLGEHRKGMINIDAAQIGKAPVGETWDDEFNGEGLPAESGWDGDTNSSMYSNDIPPGYLIANGNPGCVFSKQLPRYSKTGGWTVEWAMQAHALHQLEAPLRLMKWADDSNLVAVVYSQDSVTLKDHLQDSGETLSLVLDKYHIYRLVRQPESDTVELYIDNQPEPALSITPAACQMPHCDNSNLRCVAWGGSRYQARWDFVRYHGGATSP